MPCWVVPTVAAEMWGLPVSAVLEKIQRGEYPTRTENGFTFIDVARDSPTMDAPTVLRPPNPPAYTSVTGAEMEALSLSSLDYGLDENRMPPLPIEEWRTARRLSSRTRRPPAGQSVLTNV